MVGIESRGVQDMKWYWIVLIVVAVVVVIAIGVPTVMQHRRPPGGRASAISCLRTLSSAQDHYKTRTGKYGDYLNLWDARNNHKYIDPALSKADPDHPQHFDKAGYNIDISVNADNTDWCCIATPGTWGVDGERNFKVTSDGTIYYNATDGDTTNFTKVLGRD
jgi:hypothetical protein